MRHEKKIFIILAFVMWGVNIIRERSIFGGLGLSLVSIPLWSSLGVLIVYGGLFFYNILKPDNKQEFSIWGKAATGLIIGIISRILGWTRI